MTDTLSGPSRVWQTPPTSLKCWLQLSLSTRRLKEGCSRVCALVTCPRFGVIGCSASPIKVTHPLPTLPDVHLQLHVRDQNTTRVESVAGKVTGVLWYTVVHSCSEHHAQVPSSKYIRCLLRKSRPPPTYLSLNLPLLMVSGSVLRTACCMPHDQPSTADSTSATAAAGFAGLGAPCGKTSNSTTKQHSARTITCNEPGCA